MLTFHCLVCHKPTTNVDKETAEFFCGVVCHTTHTGLIDYGPKKFDNKFKSYRSVSEIGKGCSGRVYGVFNLERLEHTALKVQIYQWKDKRDDEYIRKRVDKEIGIMCKLSGIAGFPRLYDYYFCTELPRTGYNAELMAKGGMPFDSTVSFIEMQRGEGTPLDLFYKGQTTLIDKMYLLFEIIFALNIAHKTIGLEHRDLKNDNILYTSNEEPRSYLVGNTLIRVNNRNRPIITDFGHSDLNIYRRTIGGWDLTAIEKLAYMWDVDLFRGLEEKMKTSKGLKYYTEKGFFVDDQDYDKLLLHLHDRIMELLYAQMIDTVL